MIALNISSIWDLTKRDFSERFAGSALGAVWALIWPLVNLAIYIVVFGRLMGARLPGTSDAYAYGIYLASGLLPWTALAGTISRSTSAFLDKRHIISKVSVSLPALLLVINLSESITFLISMGFFFIFLLLSGWELSHHLMLLPFLFLLQQIFAFGFGLLTATLTVFLRDLREVVGIVLQLWFWFTPIVYVKEILPDMVKEIMIYNPSYVIIESYHRIFVFHEAPSIKALLILTVAAHGLLFVSYMVFRVLEKDVRDLL
jgi:lipopolysaccharide transport system permease protein